MKRDVEMRGLYAVANIHQRLEIDRQKINLHLIIITFIHFLWFNLVNLVGTVNIVT